MIGKGKAPMGDFLRGEGERNCDLFFGSIKRKNFVPATKTSAVAGRGEGKKLFSAPLESWYK